MTDSDHKPQHAAKTERLSTDLPIREHYLRNPGFIFRGNPKKYLTKLMAPYV